LDYELCVGFRLSEERVATRVAPFSEVNHDNDPILAFTEFWGNAPMLEFAKPQAALRQNGKGWQRMMMYFSSRFSLKNTAHLFALASLFNLSRAILMRVKNSTYIRR
jgi:hypothetical protein